jgi:hypothetical protein
MPLTCKDVEAISVGANVSEVAGSREGFCLVGYASLRIALTELHQSVAGLAGGSPAVGSPTVRLHGWQAATM